MDNSQDWELVGGGVTNGHTFIEVKRKFRTCDEDDIDITVRQNGYLECYKLFVVLSDAV